MSHTGFHKITLRRAEDTDSKLIWHWRNDSVTRANFRNNQLISWPTHRDWYAEAIKDPDRLMLIGEQDGTPFGIVRFDKMLGGAYEVSINVAPEWRGIGLGCKLLGLACQRANKKLFATIKESNTASQRIFILNGFERLNTADGYIYFSREPNS